MYFSGMAPPFPRAMLYATGFQSAGLAVGTALAASAAAAGADEATLGGGARAAARAEEREARHRGGGLEEEAATIGDAHAGSVPRAHAGGYCPPRLTEPGSQARLIPRLAGPAYSKPERRRSHHSAPSAPSSTSSAG
jgi:hypothetical protein